MDITQLDGPPFTEKERAVLRAKVFIGPFNEKLGSNCWEFLGGHTRGYSHVRWATYAGGLHRIVYMRLVSWLETEQHLDHLCRNRGCVNPEHLEVVTLVENVRRGEGITAKNTEKTHCPKGHEYTPENTYLYKGKHRHCRTCVNERNKAWRKKTGYNTNTKTRTDGK